ncbi:hypothetical protein DFH28DRAFT_1110879 [Melampsora americana]|nr:hypothetical protein DFH28DRAFT_1110879 [Melampsora americana]
MPRFLAKPPPQQSPYAHRATTAPSTPCPTLNSHPASTSGTTNSSRLSCPTSWCDDINIITNTEPTVNKSLTKSNVSKVYPCLHHLLDDTISRKPNSNLHKHRLKFPGLTEVWMNWAPGAVPPKEDPVQAPLCKKELCMMPVGPSSARNHPFQFSRDVVPQNALPKSVGRALDYPSMTRVYSKRVHGVGVLRAHATLV